MTLRPPQGCSDAVKSPASMVAGVYVGRPWQPGRWECTDCVVAAYADLTGRRIVLPRPSRSPLGRCAQIEAARTQWTRQRPQSAAQGDVALMHPRRGVWHVGIGIEDSGGLVVLHVDRERGTVVDTVSRLERLLGMRLDGWYRWIG